ncbi:MAG TPA: c-type cytochrome [Thermodesulfobacteriota bacterium]|nr:c-type cytochrome [Thermodesulfobacteriota bacterium]
MTRFRTALLLGVAVLLLSGCEYFRMRDQENVRTYEKEMPAMDSRAIPVQGGYNVLASAAPETIRNPIPSSMTVMQQGRLNYAYFCIQCHGPNLDGRGTVGQSFAPLPSNLRSPDVQGQSDGELFTKILLGFGRHPALYTTVSEEDAWKIVTYLRSFKKG